MEDPESPTESLFQQELSPLSMIYQENFVPESEELKAALANEDAGFLRTHSELQFTVHLGEEVRVPIKCTLPGTYPEKLPTIQVSPCFSALSSSVVQEINAQALALLEEYQADFEDMQGLFPVISGLESFISDAVTEDMQQKQTKKVTSAASTTTTSAEDVESKTPAAVALNRRKCKRVLFWTHHIRVKHKTCVYPAAEKFGVTGICVIGAPGFILAEGETTDVDKFTKTLKADHWKKITVNFEEIAADRYFETGSKFDEQDRPQALFDFLEQRGRRDIVDAAMRVQRSTSPNSTATSGSTTTTSSTSWGRAVVFIDHMNKGYSYLNTLSNWAQDLQLRGKVYFRKADNQSQSKRFEQIFLVLEGQYPQVEGAFQQFLKRLRTTKVDVNARVSIKFYVWLLLFLSI